MRKRMGRLNRDRLADQCNGLGADSLLVANEAAKMQRIEVVGIDI